MSSPIYTIHVYACAFDQRWRLGTLMADARQTLFEYSPEAIQRNIEFSPRYLALTQETYRGFPAHQWHLPGLFSDSLPDGWGMLLMDRYFKKQDGRNPHQIHPLERLAFLGEQTSGAFTYEPVGIQEPIVALGLTELAHAMEAVQKDQDTNVLNTLAIMGGSPQGARPKAYAYYDPYSRQMSTIAFANATPWLIKFPAQNEHPEVCAIEATYLEMASLCGCDVPPWAYIPFDNTAALAIKRFDRVGDVRIPMHSLSGAIHADYRIPNASYETFLRMTRLMTHSEAEVEKAFVRCVLNVLLNNRDDHTKNFAYLMNERYQWQLAPVYDLTFSTGMAGHHQMDIAGETLHPSREHLLRLAKGAGLPSIKASLIIDDLIEKTEQLPNLFRQYPIRVATQQSILSTIAENRQRLRA